MIGMPSHEQSLLVRSFTHVTLDAYVMQGSLQRFRIHLSRMARC